MNASFTVVLGNIHFLVPVGMNSYLCLSRELPSCSRVSTTMWLHHLVSNETHGKKHTWGTTQECCMLFRANPGSSTLQNSKSKTIQVRWAKYAEYFSEVRTNINEILLWIPTHVHVPMLADKQKVAFISSVQILDDTLMTYQMRWLIETRAKESQRNDDDDDDKTEFECLKCSFLWNFRHCVGLVFISEVKSKVGKSNLLVLSVEFLKNKEKKRLIQSRLKSSSVGGGVLYICFSLVEFAMHGTYCAETCMGLGTYLIQLVSYCDLKKL